MRRISTIRSAICSRQVRERRTAQSNKRCRDDAFSDRLRPRASGGISVAVMQQPAVVVRAEAEGAFHGADVIAVPSPAIRAYLQAYGLCAIAITRDQNVHLTRDVGRLRPLPVIAAWWGPAATSVRVKQLLDRQGSVDVLAAAASLRAVVASHDGVITRAARRCCPNRPRA